MANVGHRMAPSEGEAACRLLDEQGYSEKAPVKGKERGSRCPFHDSPGEMDRGKAPTFYLNKTSGLFQCFSPSCGERGNLRALERLFGIDVEDNWVEEVRTRDQQLQLFEMDLSKALRRPFYEHGLTDQTIERFRLGYDRASGRYVIPYLHGRRPRFFRYYDPYGDPKWKYTWEPGAEAYLYNAGDAVGDENGLVVIAESEMKAQLLVQLGYAAVGVPGANVWREEWMSLFTHARRIAVMFDNDSPDFHIYDRPDEGKKCPKCQSEGMSRCMGHNPGQDAAQRRVEQLGWRARNVLLPLPPGERKTDINEFMMRDEGSADDLKGMITGKAQTMRVSSFAEIMDSPPEETAFLVEHGILPAAGRLLVAGTGKVGKSLFIENLALSLAAGIPFLGRFGVEKPTRVLLLDRELSKRSLFDRISALIAARPAYAAGVDNLLVDHDHLIKLDQHNAQETLSQLIAMNGAEVVVLDTAYKFLSDVEKSSHLMAAFSVIDSLIAEHKCAFVLSHHRRKQASHTQDTADQDSVAGSFLWTGWPNATVLLNFIERSVENPFNVAATFTAFRDAAPPEPLALYRDKESIAYTRIDDYHPPQQQFGSGRGSGSGGATSAPTLDTETIVKHLMDACPITEQAFMHATGAMYGGEKAVRPFFLDAMLSGAFTRSGNLIRFKYDRAEESWEQEHGIQQRIDV